MKKEEFNNVDFNMELKEFLKNTVYKNFINNEIKDLEITPYYDETGYTTIHFNYGGFHFSWSVNKKGYICQHEPFYGENVLPFEKSEIKNICNIVIDYVKLYEDKNKEKLKKINELQAEINKLKSELI